MMVSHVASAAAIAALLLSPIEAGAFEFVGGTGHADGIGDGLIQPAQYRHVHPGYRPGYRPGYHPGYRPGYHPGYRPGYRPPVVGAPGAVWVGRPGWYRWAPGGAIAAGAAIGFVTAAVAVSWAGAPPQPGLCWYYTDPSRTLGFWDVCP
ncbi:MAG TPA: hypothetical protein VEH77_07210 [Roseiarcus sp.]|nr:hypothetical protein [Roseiarcus sp.]